MDRSLDGGVFCVFTNLTGSLRHNYQSALKKAILEEVLRCLFKFPCHLLVQVLCKHLSSLPKNSRLLRLGMDFFSNRACSNRQGVIILDWKEIRFGQDIRKKFFMMRVTEHWNRLSREVTDSPSLKTFKARLNRALSNLIYLKMSLPSEVGPQDL